MFVWRAFEWVTLNPSSKQGVWNKRINKLEDITFFSFKGLCRYKNIKKSNILVFFYNNNKKMSGQFSQCFNKLIWSKRFEKMVFGNSPQYVPKALLIISNTQY